MCDWGKVVVLIGLGVRLVKNNCSVEFACVIGYILVKSVSFIRSGCVMTG